MTCDDPFEVQEDDLESWVDVSCDWWRCSYEDVEWTYVRRYHWTDTGVKLTIHSRPPCYHGTLYNAKAAYGYDDETSHDLELNPELVGVKVTEDALEAYERDVGICDQFQAFPQFTFDAGLLLPEDPSEDDIRDSREDWARQVDELLGGVLEPLCSDLPVCLPDDGIIMWDLDALDHSYDSDNMPDVVDLTYSDTSVESDPMPTTPPGDKKSYAEVLFDHLATPTHAGTVVSPLPSKPLNASALSFIPSVFLEQRSPSPTADEPYVSPTYEFHFPSLSGNAASRANTRSLPPSLQRDEHGFYNEVPSESTETQSAMQSRAVTPKRSPAAGVRSFLGSSPKQGSKTREMVDRLRSSSGGSRRSRKHKGEANAQRHSVDNAIPQTAKDAEGWITGVHTQPSSSHKRSKSHNKSGDWVEGLFQCRGGHAKAEHGQRSHKRAASHAPAASANHAPPPPSSVSSSPTSSSFGNPQTPINTQFPLPQFYAFQSPYAAYPGSYPIPPQGPAIQMMQGPWPVGPMVPAHAAYVLSPPMYGPSASPYDTRKVSPPRLA
ncbi:hypothetical protein PHLGIDRAFT_364943 [Phlebiopsis gigantea 11061_1 CR5-6]|uniref:Uncharacterized protein n=1 Tax=Phlebiopsis gigantea (strain 11061_1 CR5-6) TaxID=745531 RepID=A0A0C3NTN8_PHLG1|nr:hypothetical protein PHLGIDRAFT_364943 [Phlebiopsis gigantea 11061_1 CR5-6]